MLVNGQNDVEPVNGKVNEFSENIRTVQEILRQHHDDVELQVTEIMCGPGSKAGDNYMSKIKRIGVKIKTNNNSEYSTSLIVKRQMEDEKQREMFRCDQAFTNEIAAYRFLIPVLKTFSNDNLPYPKCLFAGCDKEGEIICMEDLCQDGYKMANRIQGLDFEHCALTLRELGSYHAISLAMKVVDPIKLQDAVDKMHEVVFVDSAAEFYSSILDSSLSETILSLSNFSNANGDLDKPIEILKRLTGKQLFDIMMNQVINSDDKWKVVCHGDVWINNLMFHYHNDKVKHVKFVDLQTIRYTNFACDILMFLFSSTEGSLRAKHMDRLIEIYRESLINNLREYLEKNYREQLAMLEKEFTVENIQKELTDCALYGLGTSLWVMPAITFEPLSFEIMQSLLNLESQDSSNTSIEYHTRIRDIVKEFYERGFLDNIFIDI